MLIPPLPAGIPAVAGYERLLRSEAFAVVERYSDRFLARHWTALRPYRRKWVPDPLHQWSRQWEYPFVVSRMPDRPARVLDAGSGVTFLPFLIAETAPDADVWCCDQDASLASVFDAVDGPIRFTVADLHELPYESGSFDVVCCVSVLEHTDRQEEIVAEFHRVLRPGGRLILTADLPPDPPLVDEAVQVLSVLAAGFSDDDGADVAADLALPDRLTTSYAAKLDRRLLPWRHPLLYRLGCLATGQGLAPFPPPITVACLSLTKRR
ncbi:class I SAM-dependent methyltransferase [Amycolatopsis rubida]|uniref:Class I SAM-dependent methyltransferase n=1 Tax=Amycolatopsis rubida TaxID=112413 RepID=A0ABX0BZL7_9PSEU|nr:class I SAM-dependent methyltransferase [Amycolatopsis sp. M39]MYW94294.1 methyltransferase domain-containing protein [Amycolatopsis rubida]NEC59283.1 class I SAM-dependent methyltransferase [Amycolatopsis rubida]OAP23159.1 putative methyltransferase YcgJ [Amycolatopsis sp. M39]